MVQVNSSGWPDGEVSVYLIPEEDLEGADFVRLLLSGGLFAVAKANVVGGSFMINLQIPAELVSENGKRTRSVMAGRYNIGVQGPNDLDSSGYLTIKE